MELTREENLDMLATLAQTHAELEQFVEAEAAARTTLKLATTRIPRYSRKSAVTSPIGAVDPERPTRDGALRSARSKSRLASNTWSGMTHPYPPSANQSFNKWGSQVRAWR